MEVKNILKIILVISLVLFFLSYTKYGSNSCDLCSFEVDGVAVKSGEFLKVYSDNCFGETKILNNNLSLLNMS